MWSFIFLRFYYGSQASWAITSPTTSPRQAYPKAKNISLDLCFYSLVLINFFLIIILVSPSSIIIDEGESMISRRALRARREIIDLAPARRRRAGNQGPTPSRRDGAGSR